MPNIFNLEKNSYTIRRSSTGAKIAAESPKVVFRDLHVNPYERATFTAGEEESQEELSEIHEDTENTG